ncbi:hypothetical protein PV04_06265 [Phialophora macrospora]|uniref:Uncharacterized protein n=1 Tax=Phialophora macrospora TaxID=1851006 RepID=A0A0D2DY01_9EURO|nr:hypothetical protein PV04_06265 [Phialophora macrospora]
MSDLKATYVEYSRRKLFNKEDRPVAILGLEYRMARSWKCISLYGVMHNYGNSPSDISDATAQGTLAWKRNGRALQAIPFTQTRQLVPSWSWMGYLGQIDYICLPAHFAVDKLAVGSGKSQQGKRLLLNGHLHRVDPVSFEQLEGTNWQLVSYKNDPIGYTCVDNSTSDSAGSRPLQAVVIGWGSGILDANKLPRHSDPFDPDRTCMEYVVMLVKEGEATGALDGSATQPASFRRSGVGIFDKAMMDTLSSDGGEVSVF